MNFITNQYKKIMETNILAIKNQDNKVVYLKFCPSCGSLFSAERKDKLACCSNCRQKIFNIKRLGQNFLINSNNVAIKETEIKKCGFETSDLLQNFIKRVIV